MSIDDQIKAAAEAGERLRSGRGGWDASEYAGRDGVEAGVFTGQVNGQRWETWHGRGVYLADQEVISTQQVIEHVPQLAMEVCDRTIGWQDAQGEWHEISGDVANVRIDGTYLGTVTKRYKRVQPWECFTLLDDLLDSGDAKIANALVMKGGKQIGLLAVIPQEWKILGASDEFKLYLYLANSYDRSSGLSVNLTPIRVECTNSDNLALTTAARSFTFRHTEGITGKINAARQTLGLVAAYQEAFTEMAELLAGRKLSHNGFTRFLDDLHPRVKVEDAESQARRDTKRDAVLSVIRGVYESAPNLEPFRGTAWAALNAVTEYEDWMVPVRGKTFAAAEEKRTLRQLEPSMIKDRAVELLLARP